MSDSEDFGKIGLNDRPNHRERGTRTMLNAHEQQVCATFVNRKKSVHLKAVRKGILPSAIEHMSSIEVEEYVKRTFNKA